MHFAANVGKMDIIDQVMHFIWVITAIVKFITGEEVEHQFKVIRYPATHRNKTAKAVMLNLVAIKFHQHATWFFYGKDISPGRISGFSISASGSSIFSPNLKAVDGLVGEISTSTCSKAFLK